MSLNSKRTASHDATLLSNDVLHRRSKRTIALDSMLNKTFGRFPMRKLDEAEYYCTRFGHLKEVPIVINSTCIVNKKKLV